MSASKTYGISDILRYDTIRDAILTCARKPTWVSLIYLTEPTTKKWKTEKLKRKKRICSGVSVNSAGNARSQSWRKKEGYGEKDLQKRKVLSIVPTRGYASVGTSYGLVSVCPSQVRVLSKRMDGSSWFLAWWLLFWLATWRCKEIQISRIIRVLSSGTFSKLRTRKISPRHIDRRNVLST